jgi:heptose-I-phosphate ethanolaminephosphotransferase
MNTQRVRNILIFLIPIIVFFLFEIIFKKIGFDRVYNVIENVIFASILLIIPIYFKNLNFKKVYIKFAYFVFTFCLFFETIYYYNFDAIFSSSSIFVLLETNASEAKEFFLSYLNKYNLTAIVLFIIILLIGILKIDVTDSKKQTKAITKFKWTFVVILFLAFLKISKFIVYNVPYLAIKTSVVYYQESQLLKVYGDENQIGNFLNVNRLIDLPEKELYIVVIGESISKDHFQLCSDYYRETTPLLNKIRNDLTVCTDVISPHAFTIGSLTKGLTLGNFENPQAKYDGSIIQLLNQADFNTYWISNQRPIGISDTQITKIGKGAKTSVFLNIKHTSEKTPFDQVLVDELKEIVKEEGNNKVVFIHMLGAHINYEKRYPSEFNYFKDQPTTKFNGKDVYNTINSFDNVIRYTDYILHEIIEIAKEQGGSSFVLYFSDHGQEVYDEIDFFGQSVDKMVTKNMYEIPLFLWQSEYHKNSKVIQNQIDYKYMTDDIFHSIADLCFVSGQEIDVSRSIFNDAFKERKRIIKDSIDFDLDFKTVKLN